MRALKPYIDEVNMKYPKPEDAMKKQQETMAVYSKYGVSPMGGCIPSLIQMPFFMAFFFFVPNAIELRQQSFLWADDLTGFDDIISWTNNIPLIGNHLSIFCVLFCLCNIINTVFSMKQQQQQSISPEQEQSMKMMKWMMYIMPVVFFFSFNNYSSGLNYYYFISSLFSIGIMIYLRRTTDEKKLLAKLEAKYEASKNDPTRRKQGNNMMARLEAMQKEQERLLQQQQKNRK
jgi:YidC/Oxa1 family membrane protein insertase